MVHITQHAIERFQERVENLPDDAVVDRLRCPAVLKAAAFGAPIVRLATGHRIVLQNGSVVTVLPAHAKPKSMGHRQ